MNMWGIDPSFCFKPPCFLLQEIKLDKNIANTKIIIYQYIFPIFMKFILFLLNLFLIILIEVFIIDI